MKIIKDIQDDYSIDIADYNLLKEYELLGYDIKFDDYTSYGEFQRNQLKEAFIEKITFTPQDPTKNGGNQTSKLYLNLLNFYFIN